MDRTDLAELFSEVIRFETELWKIVDKRLREAHDLPLSWFEPMQIMERTSRCRVNDIALGLSITIGGTSKLVDRIERAGLCQRHPDPEDGRSSLLNLTPKGRQLLGEADHTFIEELELHLGSTISEQSLQQFATTVRLLRQGLRSHEASKAEL